jgi:hypothetical protein
VIAAALLIVLIVSMVYVSFFLGLSRSESTILLVRMFFLIPIPLLVIAVSYSSRRTRYKLTNDGIIVKMVWERQEIKYNSIVSVEEYHMEGWLLSMFQMSYPLSADPIDIKYTKKRKTLSVQVTPVRREEFLEKLKTKLPESVEIVRKGDEITSDYDVYRSSRTRGPVYLLFIEIALLAIFIIIDNLVWIIVMVVLVVIGALMILYVRYAVSVIKYVFREDGLRVEASWIREDIRYDKITRVSDESSIAALMFLPAAGSMDQIKISYTADLGRREGTVHMFISPVKKEEFLEKLESRLAGPGMIVRNKKDKV